MDYRIQVLVLTVASFLSTSAHAGVFVLGGPAVAESISSECEESGQSPSILCFAGFRSVGEPGWLSFFVDTSTHITNPEDFQDTVAFGQFSGLLGSGAGHFYGNWSVGWPLFSRDSEALYEPFAGGDDFAQISFFAGNTHGLSIYAYSHDALAGETWIGLSDSSGTAFAGLDLLTGAAVDNWLVNHFSMSLFDSGTWWVETFDGGGGASGRFTVPGPSSVALLGIGLFFVGLAGRRRRLRIR